MVPAILTLPDKPSIAVLPFDNLSGDSEQEYFSDGITEQIITSLSKVPNILVIARNSTFAYKGKSAKIQQIAEELAVRYVLEGSVRRAGDSVKITAQLIDAHSGYHIWSQRFDRELRDIFEVQDEIAMSIVRALQLAMGQESRTHLIEARTQDPTAYDFYLRGRDFVGQNREKAFGFARQMFSKAIKRDPSYALAHAGIADCHSYLFLYFGGNHGALHGVSACTGEGYENVSLAVIQKVAQVASL